jgi:hypothetical protein
MWPIELGPLLEYRKCVQRLYKHWSTYLAVKASLPDILVSAGSREEAKMAIKMDKTTIIVCSVVGSLGVLSAILWFFAERTKLPVSNTYRSF